MTYWEKKLWNEPLMVLERKVGLEEAAKHLKMSLEEYLFEITKLRYRFDSELFASEKLRISDKGGNVIPLVYNRGQKKIRDAIDRQRNLGKPVRICLLKARQFGGSTEFEAEIFRDSLLRPSRDSMIIAHDLDSARHLREMSERYYEYLVWSKPRLKKETDKWWKFLHFDKGKRVASNLRIDTAEELSTGHSLTLHNLHLSEVQNWRNATQLVKGLFPTVPNSPDTMIFMEGTGSGVGDYWYDFCQMAMSPETEWEFVFVPWYEIEDYICKFESIEKKNDFEESLDEEERILLKEGVGLEKLNWRRLQIRDTYKGDIDSFRQQYPASPDEAFLTSGRPVFHMMSVKRAMSKCKEGKRGYLRKGVFDEDPKGYWEIWELPEKTENLYCLGADVAEGKEVIPELGNRGGDYSAAKILRRDSRKVVAKINVRLDPDLYAEELEKASILYNCGVLVENNPGGSGNVVIRHLKSIPGLRLLQNPNLNKKFENFGDSYGWRTTELSKRQMIDELIERIREEDFEDLDKDFWYQASTYVRDEKGRTNAQSGKYDDLVIAEALMFQADKLMPMLFKPEIVEKRILTRDMDVRREERSREEILEENLAEF